MQEAQEMMCSGPALSPDTLFHPPKCRRSDRHQKMRRSLPRRPRFGGWSSSGVMGMGQRGNYREEGAGKEQQRLPAPVAVAAASARSIRSMPIPTLLPTSVALKARCIKMCATRPRPAAAGLQKTPLVVLNFQNCLPPPPHTHTSVALKARCSRMCATPRSFSSSWAEPTCGVEI